MHQTHVSAALRRLSVGRGLTRPETAALVLSASLRGLCKAERVRLTVCELLARSSTLCGSLMVGSVPLFFLLRPAASCFHDYCIRDWVTRLRRLLRNGIIADVTPGPDASGVKLFAFYNGFYSVERRCSFDISLGIPDRLFDLSLAYDLRLPFDDDNDANGERLLSLLYEERNYPTRSTHTPTCFQEAYYSKLRLSCPCSTHLPTHRMPATARLIYAPAHITTSHT